MKENNKIWLKPLIYLYLTAVTIFVSYMASKLWGSELWPNERYTMVIISSVSFVAILMIFAVKIKNIFETLVIYQATIICALLLMMVSYEYRPVMAIFMIITYIVGLDAGLMSVLGISISASFLYGAEPEYLYGTLIIGVFSCVAAYFVNSKLKFAISTVVYAAIDFFVNGIFQYYNTDKFDYKFAALSLASVVISVIIFINVYMLLRPKSVEPFIKDNSDVIKDMKDASLPLYYHSVEVAELAGYAASIIGCNRRLAYAGGMFHEIGKMEDEKDYIKEGLVLANDYGMPKEIKSIIIECDGKRRKPSSKEAAIVMLSDSVIKSIEFIKSAGKEIAESKIINNVFEIRLNEGMLDNSGFTIKELAKVKDAFCRYYDMK